MTSATQYAVTLAVPNASAPTQRLDLERWDLVRGPKGIRRRRRWEGDGDELYVPALDVWTIETMRLVLHELTKWFPTGTIRDRATARITYCDRTRRVGLVVSAMSDDSTGVEVTTSFPFKRLSEPMRAATAALPSQPLALSAIQRPEGQGDPPDTGEPEEESAAFAGVLAKLRVLEVHSRFKLEAVLGLADHLLKDHHAPGAPCDQCDGTDDDD